MRNYLHRKHVQIQKYREIMLPKLLKCVLSLLIGILVGQTIATPFAFTRTFSIDNPIVVEAQAETEVAVSQDSISSKEEPQGDSTEPSPEAIIKRISKQYGIDWKLVYAVCLTESGCKIPDCSKVSGACDGYQSMGYYQIYKQAHPDITPQQANDIAFSTEWTIKHGIKYKDNPELFCKNHNGIGKTTNGWYIDRCLNNYYNI